MIIGISGKRGSGKSLLAKYLGRYGFTKVSLADDLKMRCRHDFGLTEDQVNGIFKEQSTQYRRTDGHFLTPRDIMIRMGIFYRSVDPLFWCKRVNTFGDVVIDDIRFLNEVQFFKDQGAKFLRIERKQTLNVYKAALDDLSETELDSWNGWDFKLPEEVNVVPEDLMKFADDVAAELGVSK